MKPTVNEPLFPPATDLPIWRVTVHDMVLAIFDGAMSKYLEQKPKDEVERFLALTSEVVEQAAAAANGGHVLRSDYATVIMEIFREMRSRAHPGVDWVAEMLASGPTGSTDVGASSVEMGELALIAVRDIYGYLDDSVETGKDEVKEHLLGEYICYLIQEQLVRRLASPRVNPASATFVRALRQYMPMATITVLNDGVRRHNNEVIAALGEDAE